MQTIRDKMVLIFAFCCLCVLTGPAFSQQAKKTSIEPEIHVQPAVVSPLAPAVVTAQAPKTPEEFFARARKLSDLEAAGVPFHLKATFVATGDAEYTGNGTYEEWWQSKNVWRKEATLGSYKYVAVHNGTEKAASATMVYTPLRVRQVENLAISRVELPVEKDTLWPLIGEKHVQWHASQVATTPGALEVTTQRLCVSKQKDLYCNWRYRFREDGIVQSYSFNDLGVAYSEFQPFKSLVFPRTVTVSLQAVPMLTVEISTLETLSPGGPDRFDPKAIPNYGEQPAPVIVTWSKKDKPAKWLIPSNLKEPKSVQNLHPKSGGVVIMGTVDTAGAVREPYISVSGGPVFDEAALRAARRFKFKPAKRNGRPAVAGNTMVSFSNKSSFWSRFW